MKLYHNFKENVKERKGDIVKDIKFSYLYAILDRKFEKDTNTPYRWLHDKNKQRAVNNALILATTDEILDSVNTLDINEEILEECLVRSYQFILTMVFTNTTEEE